MELKELTLILNECLDYGDKKGFEKNIEKFIKAVPQEKATETLATYLFNRYTSFKADSIAGLLEIIIRKNKELAFLNFPDNNLFRVSILHGSLDVFDCYIEEFVEPYLQDNPKVDAMEVYIDLLAVVDHYKEILSEKERTIVKGLHFNGAFGNSEETPHAILINREDYDVMNGVVEKYNAIIGRRLIVEKLNKLIDEVD